MTLHSNEDNGNKCDKTSSIATIDSYHGKLSFLYHCYWLHRTRSDSFVTCQVFFGSWSHSYLHNRDRPWGARKGFGCLATSDVGSVTFSTSHSGIRPAWCNYSVSCSLVLLLYFMLNKTNEGTTVVCYLLLGESDGLLRGEVQTGGCHSMVASVNVQEVNQPRELFQVFVYC